MTKEDQVAFKDWIDNRTDIFSCWCAKEGFLAANPYKDKRIAELETALTEIRYIADGAIKIQPIYAIADSALSEGGADTSP